MKTFFSLATLAYVFTKKLINFKTTISSFSSLNFVYKMKFIETIGLYLLSSFHVLLLPEVSCFEANTQLKQVHVIFRHGDRTPLGPSFPLDRYSDVKSWPEGWGQLTNAGRKSQYELGRYLRNRYNGFLPSKYGPDQIYVTTSDLDRTITSALVNLAGLYQLHPDDTWNHNLQWQPIPIHTLQSQIDNKINFVPSNCPKYKLRLEQIVNSTFVQRINNAYQEFYQELTNYTGRVVKDFIAVGEIHDTLMVQKQNKMKLPDWTKSQTLEKMKPLAILSFDLITHTKEMIQLRAGPLLHEILFRMEIQAGLVKLSASEQEAFRKAKLYMYSGHDTTVTTVLTALGLYDKKHIPGYAAILIIELHELQGGVPVVKVFYRNNFENDPPQLHIQGCDLSKGMTCSLANLKKLLSGLTLEEAQFMSACKVLREDKHYKFPEDSSCTKYFPKKDVPVAKHGNIFKRISEFLSRLLFFG